jgi:7-keto-8-aminopelargonate synthetase-like enzyme
MRSNTYIFGGPVVPPYLEAISTVCDILMSPEYPLLLSQLQANVRRLANGLTRMGLEVLGGQTPILSVLVGDEADTLMAGNFLFEHGYYVQSVTFPAVPYHAGVLRIQVNANHLPASIDGLLHAIEALDQTNPLPRSQTAPRLAG